MGFLDKLFGTPKSSESEPVSIQDYLSQALKYGDVKDKIEAIALIRGRGPETLLKIWLHDEKRTEKLLRQIEASHGITAHEFESIRPVLMERIA